MLPLYKGIIRICCLCSSGVFQDILTDLAVKREDITVKDPFYNNSREIHGKVHTGMNASAEYIYHKLLEKELLEKAFRQCEVRSFFIYPLAKQS